MAELRRLLDLYRVQQIWPVHRNTVRRAEHRETDPFPPRRRICGKNFWDADQVAEWLERQGTHTDDGSYRLRRLRGGAPKRSVEGRSDDDRR